MNKWKQGRRTLLWTAPVVVALMIWLVVAAGQPSTSRPVYTVAQIKEGLDRHPGRWMGHNVLVRGLVVTIHHSMFGAGLALSSVGPLQTTVLVPDLPALRHNERARLSYVFNTRPSSILLVRVQQPNALLSSLERIPLLDTLVTRRGDVGAMRPVYRLHLLTPQQSCVNNQCADAVLVDATP